MKMSDILIHNISGWLPTSDGLNQTEYKKVILSFQHALIYWSLSGDLLYIHYSHLHM